MNTPVVSDATENQAKANFQWGGLLFLLAVLGLLVVAVWHAQLWLQDAQRAPVEKINLFGERRFIDDAALVTEIRQQHPESFFSLDVQQVHQTIVAEPWVHRASVRKRWPKTLNVHLTEQIPAAFWNHDLLLNTQGETFAAPFFGKTLPKLFGPEGGQQTALQGYLAMQSLLSPLQLQITELQLSERYAWHLTLNNGVALKLGRSEFLDRLQRFVDLYPMLVKDPRAIDYVDLRYDTGLAVGWQQTTELRERDKLREANNV